ncbi:flagellar motor stator protein MotA [Desulfomicrobium sp. ZS1]|uniref:flagellar motor stator protein MotA n=1 Tax=Desulfomicrobium sp. ZS1 TaxID=2952228 RepID=UPI002112801B|nr:flagellar motor stator protein MotA [Desulfomicrobium sp. ZS1]
MFAIIGLLVVIGCVAGGYVMGHGNLSVLWQPAEFIIILGAAIGTFLIASPIKVIKLTMKGFASAFKAKAPGKDEYLQLLRTLYDLLTLAKHEGIIALESHANKPKESSIFTPYPFVIKNHHVLDFICDNVKTYAMAGMEPHEFETLMDIDIDAHHEEEMIAAGTINKLADSMPALGIVACVLGVVITMGAINEPPEILGKHIGAALVGTFFGILMAYGFVAPFATNVEHQVRDQHTLMNVAKTAIMSFALGWAPALALEAARRAVPSSSRPTFEELENAVRKK